MESRTILHILGPVFLRVTVCLFQEKPSMGFPQSTRAEALRSRVRHDGGRGGRGLLRLPATPIATAPRLAPNVNRAGPQKGTGKQTDPNPGPYKDNKRTQYQCHTATQMVLRNDEKPKRTNPMSTLSLSLISRKVVLNPSFRETGQAVFASTQKSVLASRKTSPISDFDLEIQSNSTGPQENGKLLPVSGARTGGSSDFRAARAMTSKQSVAGCQNDICTDICSALTCMQSVVGAGFKTQTGKQKEATVR